MGDSVVVTDGEYKDTVGIAHSIKRGEGAKLYRIALETSIEVLLARELFRSELEYEPMAYTWSDKILIHEGPPAPHWIPIAHERIGTNLLKGHKIVLCHRDFKRVKQYLQFDNGQIILYPYCKTPYVVLSSNITADVDTNPTATAG